MCKQQWSFVMNFSHRNQICKQSPALELLWMGILGLIIARQHMFLYPILVTVQTAVVTMRHQYLVRVQLKATGCQKSMNIAYVLYICRIPLNWLQCVHFNFLQVIRLDSSVSIVTNLWLDGYPVSQLNSWKEKRFFSSLQHPTSSAVLSATYPMGTGLLMVVKWLGCEVYHSLASSARDKKMCGVTLHFSIHLMVWCLTFILQGWVFKLWYCHPVVLRN